MRKAPLLISVLCCLFPRIAIASIIYIDPDAVSGNGSIDHPFTHISDAMQIAQGLAKLTSASDIILYLKQGAEFNENVVISPQTTGNVSSITITSDPQNRAVINPKTYLAKTAAIASPSGAISVYNQANVTIENLTITGSGMDANTESGINAYADNARYNGLTIRNCEVKGWGKEGIVIGGWGGAYGFNTVLVENCASHDNKKVGLTTYAQTVDGNTNVTVRHCSFYNNLGDPAASTHTGSGIVLGQVTDGLIEYCTAYNNGERCSTTGGPVGIWAYDATRVTIQFCEAYNNHAINCDGGGFDLDGGCQQCIIQYCWSHENDGAGYLICQYSGARLFSGNIFRYNISQNDGKKNDFAGIQIWSAGSSGGIQNTQVYGNTIYNSLAPAIHFLNIDGQSGNRYWNNIFITANGQQIVKGSPSTGVALFQNNCYWTIGGTASIAGYSSLNAWRTATNQEKNGSNSTGVQADPLLENPGNGGITGVDALASLTQYHMASNSPCINAGFDLAAASVNFGNRDYYGTTVPQNSAFDIGACEYFTATSSGIPALAQTSHQKISTPVLFDLSGRKNSAQGNQVTFTKNRIILQVKK